VATRSVSAGSGGACHDGVYTTGNAWLRLSDLGGDHRLNGTFFVDSVDWGMEAVTGSLDIIVNVYCLDDGSPFLYAFLDRVGSATTPVADEALVFHNTPVSGACDTAMQSMAVELFGDDCEIQEPTCCPATGGLTGPIPSNVVSPFPVYSPWSTMVAGFLSRGGCHEDTVQDCVGWPRPGFRLPGFECDS
jgi:hypothetical protein